jgi:hypothetical protein
LQNGLAKLAQSLLDLGAFVVEALSLVGRERVVEAKRFAVGIRRAFCAAWFSHGNLDSLLTGARKAL